MGIKGSRPSMPIFSVLVIVFVSPAVPAAAVRVVRFDAERVVLERIPSFVYCACFRASRGL